MQAAALIALTLSSASSCRPEHRPEEIPLRPLLHTEPREGTTLPEGFGLWTSDIDPVAWPSRFLSSAAVTSGSLNLMQATTPDRLVLDAYYALVNGEEDRLMRHLFSPEELSAAARMGSDTALTSSEAIASEVAALYAAFNSGPVSQRRAGGLANLLEPGQVTVGRPRSLDGSAVPAEAAEMHWGSEMSFRVRGTELNFTLRFPNLLVGSDGLWRLRSAPDVDARFVTWRRAGFDLTPAMMENDHAAFPVDVGNYWHYSTRRPGPLGDEGEPDRQGSYRDEVASVESFPGYRYARLRRSYDDTSVSSERYSLLVTPLRVYSCDRECASRRANAAWILAYAHREIPLLQLPLSPGDGWGPGGRQSSANPVRVMAETEEVSTPAGVYVQALPVVRSTSRGRQTRFFVPSVGFVSIRTESATSTIIEELTDVRILQ